MQEKIIENKQCKHCNIDFDITDKDLEFYEKVSPVFGGNKCLIPSPTLCPECRHQRRLSWRNERKLYKRKCDATGKSIISIYSPDKCYKVYNSDFWYSDKFDALDYGIEFNFKRGFFEQFLDLQKVVPRLSILNMNSENSQYTNHAYYEKDCYFDFEAGYNEDSLYSTTIWNSKRCVDCEICHDSENSYQCQYIKNCQSCYFSLRLKDCFNCVKCIDCINCKNCFGSSNLVGKEYCIYDKQYSKIEYQSILSSINTDIKLDDKKIVKSLNSINCENSIGNDIDNCNECSHIYDCGDLENVKYSWKIFSSKNCYDYDIWGENSENVYEVHCSGISYNVMFSNIVWGESSNVYYSDNCLNGSNNLFGCIGLKNNSYCIFNKQYTKEEYNKLVPEIIKHMKQTGEWGEFFPSSISPFGYNETVAMEYFPIIKENAENKGFNWSDYESPKPNVEKIISADKLPEKIEDIPDDILNWAIECEVTKKPFRIIKAELDFYRKHNLPIPKRHPDQRHIDRMKLRNPRKLFDRECDKCGISMKTTYSPEREELVYCEGCYNKEVY